MRTVKTFYITYKDLNNVEQVETVEAYSEKWAKVFEKKEDLQRRRTC